MSFMHADGGTGRTLLRRGRHHPLVAVATDDAAVLGGMLAGLRTHGFDHTAQASVVTWAGAHTHALVLLAITATSHWQMLSRLVQHDARVVVVLPQVTALPCRRAIVAGAMAVLPLDATVDETLNALQAARRGHILMPATVLRRVLAPTCAALPEPERELLEQLASSRTVAEIARERGCSERTLYRRVQSLYSRLQVTGRKQAVALWHDALGGTTVSVSGAGSRLS